MGGFQRCSGGRFDRGGALWREGNIFAKYQSLNTDSFARTITES